MSLTLHGDQVDADGVVPVERKCEHELGAHAVGPRDEDRVTEALADLDQSAKTPDAGQHLGPHGALGEGLDPLDERIITAAMSTPASRSERLGRESDGGMMRIDVVARRGRRRSANAARECRTLR